MKLVRTSLMLLVALGLAGCGDNRPVDASNLVTPSADQNAAIAAHDRSIDEEEFRKPEAGSKVPRSLARKQAGDSN